MKFINNSKASSKEARFITIILIVSAGLITSCNDNLIRDTAQEKSEITEVKELTNLISINQIKISYQGQTRPNTYTAQIEWPAFDGTIYFLDHSKVKLSYDPITTNQFKISDLQGGVEKIIFLKAINEKRNQNLEIELKLLPPKDLVIDGQYNFNKSQNLPFERIFINDNSHLITEEHTIRLQFNELHIGNNVSVSHFLPTQNSTFQINGRNGGSLELIGYKAIGFIKFNINAEGGSNGRDGFLNCNSVNLTNPYCLPESGTSPGSRGNYLLDIQNVDYFGFSYQFLDPKVGQPGINNTTPLRDHANLCNWYKNHPNENPGLNFNCNLTIQPKSGIPSSGGSICIKNNKGNNYECVSKI